MSCSAHRRRGVTMDARRNYGCIGKSASGPSGPRLCRAPGGAADGSAQDVGAQLRRPAVAYVFDDLRRWVEFVRVTGAQVRQDQDGRGQTLDDGPTVTRVSEGGEEQRFLLRDTVALRHCERS